MSKAAFKGQLGIINRLKMGSSSRQSYSLLNKKMEQQGIFTPQPQLTYSSRSVPDNFFSRLKQRTRLRQKTEARSFVIHSQRVSNFDSLLNNNIGGAEPNRKVGLFLIFGYLHFNKSIFMCFRVGSQESRIVKARSRLIEASPRLYPNL